MTHFARAIEEALNAPERASIRAALAVSLPVGRPDLRMARRPPRHPLDPRSERELAALLSRLRPAHAEGELVRACIAGYQYAGGMDLESEMTIGDALELVREPDHPRDPLAVSVRWAGHRIGYVPRTINADIARRLDAGEPLVCCLMCIDADARPWERVEFVIRPGAHPSALHVD
jgi:hypothetical protein